MLTKASESGCDTDAQFVKNTKGVIFYSTPHAGSQVAKLSATSKFLFFPSTEVKDLEANSPQLCSLNQSFRNLVSFFLTIEGFKILKVSFTHRPRRIILK